LVEPRNETDLEALGDDHVGAVREAMQPTHVSWWLHRVRPRNGERAEWHTFLTVSLYQCDRYREDGVA
jgi:hypothetical protein